MELRLCASSWTMLDALDTLIRDLGGKLVQELCLKYRPVADSRAAKKLCSKQCDDLPPQLRTLSDDGSRLKRKQVVDAADVQAYIRRSGAVLTRIDVYEDFNPFFERDPRGVYMGPSGEAARKEPVSSCRMLWAGF